MNKKNQLDQIIIKLEKKFPNPSPALNFQNPWELLIAVILSAQCTDKRVNIVTKTLFKEYKTALELGSANISDIEKIIFTTGFYRNKAKNIKESSKIIAEKLDNKLPRTIDEIIKLPGVGRKTANVVLYNAFGLSFGIAVDTHVIRVSNLLGLTKSKNPQIIEKDLMKITPKKYWGNLTHFLILHGRQTCIANRPKCNECILKKLCVGKKG